MVELSSAPFEELIVLLQRQLVAFPRMFLEIVDDRSDTMDAAGKLKACAVWHIGVCLGCEFKRGLQVTMLEGTRGFCTKIVVSIFVRLHLRRTPIASLLDRRKARDGVYHQVASHGFPPNHIEYMRNHPLTPDRTSIAGRVVLEGRSIHIPDVQGDPELTLMQASGVARVRTALGVPMLREGNPIGVLVLARATVEPFTEKQIELVTTFADQAVIAIQNVRLFDEVQTRTRELSEALEQQTATSEVLGVISSSPGELEPIFQAMLANATRLCGAEFGVLEVDEGDGSRIAAVYNVPPALAATQQTLFRIHPKSGHAEVRRTKH
jgi:hypothetical protein